MATQALDTPVLVVGAGPVGSVLALELARHDVPTMVIERSLRPSVHPKMDYLTGRSMELLRRLGLAEQIRDRGVRPEHPTNVAWTQGLHRPPVLVWHHPSVDEMRQRAEAVNDGTVPVEPYQRVPGSVLEGIVRDAARRHPLIDVREGWTFSDLHMEHMEAAGVTATVIAPSTTVRHAVRARYIVACDGARSTVRRCLGIGLDESGTPTQHCSVYFTSRDPALRRYGRAFVTIVARGLTLVSRDEGDEWTGSFPIPADEPLTGDPISLIQERLGIELAVDQVISTSQWEGSLGVATSYRKGSAYLAGDSAHQFYPTGGHGANTGIADAVDLGWKLAAELAGWGGPRLLASYELERRPVALFNRELSAHLLEIRQRFARLTELGIPAEQIAGVLEQDVHHIDNQGVHFGYRYTTSPVICHEGGRAPAWHWRHIAATTWPGGRAPALRLADGTALFDRLGVGFTLVDLSGSGIGEPLVKEASRRGIPMSYLPLNDVAVRSCWERDLVLVRPDQHVAWRGDERPEAWDTVLDRVTGRDPVNT